MTMTDDQPTSDHDLATAYADGPPEVQHAALADLERTPVDDTMDRWRSGDDVEVRRERLPEPDAWDRMAAMAQKLAHAPTMPAHIKNSRDPEADMMVVLLTAHDLGLSATVALQKVNVIEGKPAMAAELMRMLVRRDGHSIWCEIDKDPQGEVLAVTWFGIRKEDPDRTHEATFSIEEAKQAGLAGKDVWKKYREDMLSARATSRLCRRVFEDCLAGVSYTPEELGTITVEPLEPAAPEDPPVAEENLVALRATIAALTDAERAVVAVKWKEQRLGSISEKRGPEIPPLRVSQMPVVASLIAAAKVEAVEDAEVVVPAELAPHAFEGSESATECATCGRGREDALHGAQEAEATSGPSDEDLEAEANAARQALADSLAAEVAKLTTIQLTDALTKAKLSIAGDPKMRRARLVDWRFQEAMTADVI